MLAYLFMDCFYGCGQHAIYVNESGHPCCSESRQLCPALRKKNSNGVLRKIGSPGYVDPHVDKAGYWRGKAGPTNGLKLTRFPPEKEERLREMYRNLGRQNGGRAKTPEKEAERRRKISSSGKGRTGGYRKGSGVGHKGWYRGYWCESSWEIAYVLFNTDRGVSFDRNWKKFQYFDNLGNPRKYTPDFRLPDGTYIEIKGYKSSQWLLKESQFTDKLIVLYEKEIKPYLDYAISKYGSKFWEGMKDPEL